MKKLFLLMLIASITSESYAQYQPNSESIFEMPATKINRKFLIELGRNDKMQIELTNMKDLSKIRNIDSIVALFLIEITPLKDSLKEGIFSRRIDYIVDTSSYKKIRIQKFNPGSSHFVIVNGKTSLLKLEQDTITILGKVRGKVRSNIFGDYIDYSYYRVSFFLNNLNDLALYVDGTMNEKVRLLEMNLNTAWINNKISGVHLQKDPDITAAYLRGYNQINKTYLLRLAVNIQNYKNNFVPSTSYGFGIVVRNEWAKHKLGIHYENHFSFSKNDSGALKTHVNDFLTVFYERENKSNDDTREPIRLAPSISIGYLIRRDGNLYAKNTFKLGLGRFAPFGGSFRIEPTFYFNNFFNDFSPSLRFTQYF